MLNAIPGDLIINNAGTVRLVASNQIADTSVVTNQQRRRLQPLRQQRGDPPSCPGRGR